MKFLYLILITATLNSLTNCKSPAINWSYQIECNGLGAQGIQSLKVKTRANSKSNLRESAMKNAVHSAIFRGAPIGNTGCPKLPMVPMSAQNEEVNKKFFEEFFKNGGTYNTFIASSPVLISPVTFISKGVYEGEYTVGVRYNALKQYLKENKILHSFDNGM